MFRWLDYFVDPPRDTASEDANCLLLRRVRHEPAVVTFEEGLVVLVALMARV